MTTSDGQPVQGSAATGRVDPPQVVMSGLALRQLVALAQRAVTEHLFAEVKIRDGCAFEPCDRSDHSKCAVWGSQHDPSCPACVPIRIARRALGDAL